MILKNLTVLIFSAICCLGAEELALFNAASPLPGKLKVRNAELLNSSDVSFSLQIPAMQGWPQVNITLPPLPDAHFRALKFQASFSTRPADGWTVALFHNNERLAGGYLHQVQPDQYGFYRITFNQIQAGKKFNRLQIAFKNPSKEIQAAFSDFTLTTEPEPFDGMVNLAKGKQTIFLSAPNYPHCSGPSDATDLTDGKFLDNDREKIWMQPGAVGWRTRTRIIFDIDLEQIEPIARLRYHTGAGIAGVRFPLAVYVLGSNDRKNFAYLGELINPNQAKFPEYNTRLANLWLDSEAINAKARYIRFIVRCDGLFHFADEVEIFRGNTDKSRPVTELPMITGTPTELMVMFSAAEGLKKDCALIKGNADALGVDVGAELQQLQQKFNSDWKTWLHCTTTVAPFNRAQHELLALNGKIMRESGWKQLMVWNGGRWDPFNLFSLPPQKTTPAALILHGLRGERRGTMLNFTNPLETESVSALTASKELPVRFFEAVCMDNNLNFLNCNMLKPVTELRIPGGASVQLWLEFDLKDVQPGQIRGMIEIAGQTVPVELNVGKFRMPERFHSVFGTFDYLNNLPSQYRGVNADNFPDAAALIAKYQINSIWGSLPVMPWVDATAFSPDDKLIKKLDYRAFDAWCTRFAAAEHLTLFCYPARRGVFAGIDYHKEPERFKKRLSAWLADWLKHTIERGIAPGKIKLHFLDEVNSDAEKELYEAWAGPVRETQQDGKRFQTYFNPRIAPGDNNDYPSADILVPAFGGFAVESINHYRKLAEQRKNGSFGLYLCSGNSRVLDPYSYYSLPVRCGILFPEFYGFELWSFTGAPPNLDEYAYDQMVFSPFYFNGNSIYASKQIEGVQEGRQDYEYYLLLEKLTQYFQNVNPDIAKKCREMLDETKNEILGELKGPAIRIWGNDKNRNIAEMRRVKIWKLLDMVAAKYPEAVDAVKSQHIVNLEYSDI